MRKSRAADHHGSEFAHFRMDAKCPFHWSVSLCWPVQRPGERQASFIEGHTSKDEYSVGSLIQINLRRWPPSAISKISEAGPPAALFKAINSPRGNTTFGDPHPWAVVGRRCDLTELRWRMVRNIA